MKDDAPKDDDTPLGIPLSMLLFAIYTYMLDRSIQLSNINNWILSIIYLIPLIFLYIGIPILIRKYEH